MMGPGDSDCEAGGEPTLAELMDPVALESRLEEARARRKRVLAEKRRGIARPARGFIGVVAPSVWMGPAARRFKSQLPGFLAGVTVGLTLAGLGYLGLREAPPGTDRARHDTPQAWAAAALAPPSPVPAPGVLDLAEASAAPVTLPARPDASPAQAHLRPKARPANLRLAVATPRVLRTPTSKASRSSAIATDMPARFMARVLHQLDRTPRNSFAGTTRVLDTQSMRVGRSGG